MNSREQLLLLCALVIFLSFGLFIICAIANADELHITMQKDTVTMPIKTFKFMASTMQAQQHEIKQDEDEIENLTDLIHDLETCVRKAAMNSKATLPCFNRTQFRNPDHKHPTVDGD